MILPYHSRSYSPWVRATNMFDDEVSILTWDIHDKSVDYWTDARLRTIGLRRLIEDGFEAVHEARVMKVLLDPKQCLGTIISGTSRSPAHRLTPCQSTSSGPIGPRWGNHARGRTSPECGGDRSTGPRSTRPEPVRVPTG